MIRWGWRAVYDTVEVAAGGPSVHACAVFLRAESRDGDKFNQTPYVSLVIQYSTYGRYSIRSAL